MKASINQQNKEYFYGGYLFGLITGFAALLLVWGSSAFFDVATQNFVRGCATFFLMFVLALILAMFFVFRATQD